MIQEELALKRKRLQIGRRLEEVNAEEQNFKSSLPDYHTTVLQLLRGANPGGLV